jgi:hypothetical protein
MVEHPMIVMAVAAAAADRNRTRGHLHLGSVETTDVAAAVGEVMDEGHRACRVILEGAETVGCLYTAEQSEGPLTKDIQRVHSEFMI